MEENDFIKIADAIAWFTTNSRILLQRVRNAWPKFQRNESDAGNPATNKAVLSFPPTERAAERYLLARQVMGEDLAFGEHNKPPAWIDGHRMKVTLEGNPVTVYAGKYYDGHLAEIAISTPDETANISKIWECFATAVSLGLQHGVPLATYVEKFVATTDARERSLGSHSDEHLAEPGRQFFYAVEGFSELTHARSVPDLVFRILGIKFLRRAELGTPLKETPLPEEDATEEIATPVFTLRGRGHPLPPNPIRNEHKIEIGPETNPAIYNITITEHPIGKPAGIQIIPDRDGGIEASALYNFSKALSICMRQGGIPWRTLAKHFVGVSFEPSGNLKVPDGDYADVIFDNHATSPISAIFQLLDQIYPQEKPAPASDPATVKAALRARVAAALDREAVAEVGRPATRLGKPKRERPAFIQGVIGGGKDDPSPRA